MLMQNFCTTILLLTGLSFWLKIIHTANTLTRRRYIFTSTAMPCRYMPAARSATIRTNGSRQARQATRDSVFTPAQTGKYYAQITNTIATQLTLTTDTVTYVAPLATKENNLLAEKPVEMNNVTHTFSAYPNPANTIIRVQVKGNTAFVISNIAGKILLVKDISNSGIISVSGLVSGVYYMQNKTTGEVKKRIVKH